jgi:hypothetical protein
VGGNDANESKCIVRPTEDEDPDDDDDDDDDEDADEAAFCSALSVFFASDAGAISSFRFLDDDGDDDDEDEDFASLHSFLACSACRLRIRRCSSQALLRQTSNVRPQPFRHGVAFVKSLHLEHNITFVNATSATEHIREKKHALKNCIMGARSASAAHFVCPAFKAVRMTKVGSIVFPCIG